MFLSQHQVLQLKRKQRFKIYESKRKFYNSVLLNEKESNFDHTKFGVLKPSDLEFLDVLFISNKIRFDSYISNIPSKVIQFALNGKYNHVAIVAKHEKDFFIFESVPKYGVIRTRFNKWIEKYKSGHDIIHVAKPRKPMLDDCKCKYCSINNKLDKYINKEKNDLDSLDKETKHYIKKYHKKTESFFCSSLAETFIRKAFKIYDYELPGRNPCTLEEWLYKKMLIDDMYPLVF